ncbi:DUF3883 domain-containing protein [Streptococcus uberis]|uniref:DUF3883 domain-containing protein n=1 Tax=Streptococcus uberis TaxID=1349 RepID=UPI002EBA123C|nr:DUF3883 domain-containing protein [Streptococcus uberis]
MSNKNRHKNFEILNLIGYGLAKYDTKFVNEFGFTQKSSFYQYLVELEIAETHHVISNRMDAFDPFFNNGRKGWWQRKEQNRSRFEYLDAMYSDENVKSFSNVVKLYIKDHFKINIKNTNDRPLQKSKYKRLQETGFEAEEFFKSNYETIKMFSDYIIEDARLYGEGFDFQASNDDNFYLIEVKGIRDSFGKIRLTQNEFQKAKEFENQFVLVIVTELNDKPKINLIQNPIKQLKFIEKQVEVKEQVEYHLEKEINFNLF